VRLLFRSLRLSRLDDAVADYSEALRSKPKQAGSLYGRGLAKLKKGDAAGSEADIAGARAIQADVAEKVRPLWRDTVRRHHQMRSADTPGIMATIMIVTASVRIRIMGRLPNRLLPPSATTSPLNQAVKHDQFAAPRCRRRQAVRSQDD
jgi:hypothetical protein